METMTYFFSPPVGYCGQSTFTGKDSPWYEKLECLHRRKYSESDRFRFADVDGITPVSMQ